MTSWLSCPNPRPQARWRLYCFPYAGGSARLYRDWAYVLPAQVEVCPIELPGRGRRFADSPFTDLNQLVQSLGKALTGPQKPFVCFGHSLGGLIAFELSRWLRHHQQPEPQQLWISAARAPNLGITDPPIHTLPTPEFMLALRRYNGTPAAILDNVELMELMLPVLRADFALLETYRYQAQRPLTCAITALWGEQDQIVRREDMTPWQIHTEGPFWLRQMPGDHFFVHQPQIVHLLQSQFADA